jgi:WD40 repeat protein
MQMNSTLCKTLIILCALPLAPIGQCDSILNKPLGAHDVAVKVADLPEQYHDVIVRGVAFSPDGKFLAADSDGEKIDIWNWHSARIERTVEKPRGASLARATNPVGFSPDGRLFAACHSKGVGDVVSRIWNTTDWSIAHEITEPQGGGCNAATFSSDGQSFFGLTTRIGSPGYSLTSYNTKNWEPVWGISLGNIESQSIAISGDGLRAALGGLSIVQSEGQFGRKPIINIVDLQQHKISKVLEGNAMGPMAWSPDGKRLAVVGQLYVEIFDSVTSEKILDVKTENSGIRNVRFTSDAQFLIESDLNGQGRGLGVKIWDGQHQKLLQEIPGDIGSIDVSKDSKYLAVGTTGRTTIWQLKQ